MINSALSAGSIGGYLTQFLAGALLCNALPHLVAGLQGRTFPTPFAQPRGVAESSAVVNFLWGFGNLMLGGWIVLHRGVPLGLGPDLLAMAIGALSLGLYLSVRFQRMRNERTQGSTQGK